MVGDLPSRSPVGVERDDRSLALRELFEDRRRDLLDLRALFAIDEFVLRRRDTRRDRIEPGTPGVDRDLVLDASAQVSDLAMGSRAKPDVNLAFGLAVAGILGANTRDLERLFNQLRRRTRVGVRELGLQLRPSSAADDLLEQRSSRLTTGSDSGLDAHALPRGGNVKVGPLFRQIHDIESDDGLNTIGAEPVVGHARRAVDVGALPTLNSPLTPEADDRWGATDPDRVERSSTAFALAPASNMPAFRASSPGGGQPEPD